jgi:hypothetical protein
MGIRDRHQQAIEDHQYLNRIGCDHDCVEIDAEVFNLMRDPTIKRALRMWESAIAEWFFRYRDELPDDARVTEIGIRYGHIQDTAHD